LVIEFIAGYPAKGEIIPTPKTYRNVGSLVDYKNILFITL
jgi:hypothetical protein